MSKHNTVFGCFKTVEGARVAIDRLVAEGIPQDRLGMLVSSDARKHLATLNTHTKAAEGAATGGLAGGALGALAAGLTTVAAVVAPGVGLLAAGPIVAMLAGAGAGAAAGGTIGALIGFTVPETEVERVSDIVRGDGVVVTVSTDDREHRETAKRVLDGAGALVVKSRDGDFAHL
jgi:hypothetical protein